MHDNQFCPAFKPCRGSAYRALGGKPFISVIIPTLNERATVGELLAGLPPGPDLEIILVDGGSADGTLEIAGRFPHVKTLESPPGRGRQMNAGVLASWGELLVFLHADTHLGPEHLDTLRRLIHDPVFQAGAFRFALAPPLPALRFIARGVNARCRVFGLPYGDQALTVRRELFFRVGGYTHRRPEDLDLVIRLKKYTRLRLLEPPAATSARRWLEHGHLRTTLRNYLFLARHLGERTFTRGWPEVGDIKKVGGGGDQGFEGRKGETGKRRKGF
jgi:rSAM/selenodomain-associated transferase 2